jgi:hypothetical protein
VDTILGILPGENYSGIRVLMDLSICVKHTNKLSGVVARKTVAELTLCALNIPTSFLALLPGKRLLS